MRLLRVGLQIFAIVWSLLFTFYCFFGDPASASLTNWVLGALSLLPIIIYLFKILAGKRQPTSPERDESR